MSSYPPPQVGVPPAQGYPPPGYPGAGYGPPPGSYAQQAPQPQAIYVQQPPPAKDNTSCLAACLGTMACCFCLDMCCC